VPGAQVGPGLVATLVRSIFAQPDAASTWAQHARIVEQLAERFSAPAELLADAAGELLAFTAFSKEHWRQIWSTNPLERLNRELRRRSDVVGMFPNREAVLRLAGRVLAEQHDVRGCLCLLLGVTQATMCPAWPWPSFEVLPGAMPGEVLDRSGPSWVQARVRSAWRPASTGRRPRCSSSASTRTKTPWWPAPWTSTAGPSPRPASHDPAGSADLISWALTDRPDRIGVEGAGGLGRQATLACSAAAWPWSRSHPAHRPGPPARPQPGQDRPDRRAADRPELPMRCQPATVGGDGPLEALAAWSTTAGSCWPSAPPTRPRRLERSSRLHKAHRRR
jgi:hypothetical protein